jgi:hypothetical protein
VMISDLSFTPDGGTAVHGVAQTTDGIASTRRGNAALWAGMIGKVSVWRMGSHSA